MYYILILLIIFINFFFKVPNSVPKSVPFEINKPNRTEPKSVRFLQVWNRWNRTGPIPNILKN